MPIAHSGEETETLGQAAERIPPDPISHPTAAHVSLRLDGLMTQSRAPWKSAENQ